MAKITKPQLVEKILKVRNNIELVKEANELIDYNIKAYNENARNVTLEELKDIVSYIEEVTGEEFNELLESLETEEEETLDDEEAVERIINIVEPKKEEKKEEKKVKTLPKKENKVKEPKTEEPKQDSKKELKTTHKTIELLASFPETLESTVLKAKLKLRNDLKSIEEVVDAFNDEQDIVLAMYWTKRHLKQYASSYDPLNINPNKPKEFEHDLDLVEITYANNLVVTGCSLYSYIPQVLLPVDFTVDEEGMRYANGCEFQIYEIVEG